MTELDQIAERVALLRSDDLNQSLGYHSWVSDAHRYVCMTVPKVACSRVKLTLHLLEGGTQPESLGDVHEEGIRLAAFEDSEVVRRLGSKNWLLFCFVRNPYERLLSAYKTQIGNTWNDQYDWVKEEIKRTYGYPAGDPAQLVAFRDFALYLPTASERVRRDGHFNIQSNILMPDVVDYDMVGRFEDLAADFSRVLQCLQAPAEIVATTHEVKNATPSVQSAIAYDKELADVVYEFYGEDFERYQYDRNSWMLEK